MDLSRILISVVGTNKSYPIEKLLNDSNHIHKNFN